MSSTQNSSDRNSSTPTSAAQPQPELCANNCGFFGNPATSNLCSKCFEAVKPKPPTTITTLTKEIPTAMRTTAVTETTSTKETPTTMCANNCGFFGNPATLNLCSKCFEAVKPKTPTTTTTTTTVTEKTSTKENSSTTLLLDDSAVPAPPNPDADKVSSSCSSAGAPPKPANRCKSCTRKVGMLGFVCKCGDTFCGTHRYPEKHECGVDYKAVGREAIKKANPLVKVDKITRF